MDLTIIIIITLLVLTIAFVFIDYKRTLRRRKKIRQIEVNNRKKVFEEALRLIDQYRQLDRRIT